MSDVGSLEGCYDESNKKSSRYFKKDQDLIKCRNCQQLGHIARYCFNETKHECRYCLGEHDSSMCGQNCFRCGGTGHISSNCPRKVERRCNRCYKFGHVEKECQFLITSFKGIGKDNQVTQRMSAAIDNNYDELLCPHCEWSFTECQCTLFDNATVQKCRNDCLYNRGDIDYFNDYINIFADDKDFSYQMMERRQNLHQRRLSEILDIGGTQFFINQKVSEIRQAKEAPILQSASKTQFQISNQTQPSRQFPEFPT
jgi:cellular nucleic acid-binding protein